MINLSETAATEGGWGGEKCMSIYMAEVEKDGCLTC